MEAAVHAGSAAFHIQATRQRAFLAQAAADASAHGGPDVEQSGAGFGLGAPGSFVAQHQIGQAQIVLAAECKHLFGIVERQFDFLARGAGLSFDGLGLVDDETAADGIVGVLVDGLPFLSECGEAHGVGVARQADGLELQVALPVEGNGVNACQRQAGVQLHGIHGLGHLVRIDLVGLLAHQAGDDGTVSPVADAGRRERAVELDLHTLHGGQQAGLLQMAGKIAGRPHGTHGVGAGGADADLEQVECADHGCLKMQE